MNKLAWKRTPLEVAREGLASTLRNLEEAKESHADQLRLVALLENANEATEEIVALAMGRWPLEMGGVGSNDTCAPISGGNYINHINSATAGTEQGAPKGLPAE